MYVLTNLKQTATLYDQRLPRFSSVAAILKMAEKGGLWCPTNLDPNILVFWTSDGTKSAKISLLAQESYGITCQTGLCARIYTGD